MALRSFAGKLRSLLPRRAAAPRSADLDLEKELARFRSLTTEDIIKRNIEELRLLREEYIRKRNRDTVLIVAGVGLTAYEVSCILEDLDTLAKLKCK